MTALHLVYSPEALEACLTRIGHGDAVLLLCDGAGFESIQLGHFELYALVDGQDGDGITKLSQSRFNQGECLGGLEAASKASSSDEWLNGFHPPVQKIDYSEMVALTLRHHPIVTWT